MQLEFHLVENYKLSTTMSYLSWYLSWFISHINHCSNISWETSFELLLVWIFFSMLIKIESGRVTKIVIFLDKKACDSMTRMGYSQDSWYSHLGPGLDSWLLLCDPLCTCYMVPRCGHPWELPTLLYLYHLVVCLCNWQGCMPMRITDMCAGCVGQISPMFPLFPFLLYWVQTGRQEWSSLNCQTTAVPRDGGSVHWMSSYTLRCREEWS